MKQTRWLRLMEALAVFAGIPLVFYWNLTPVPKIAALLAVMIWCLFVLRRDGSFHFTRTLRWPSPGERRVLTLGLHSLAVAVAVTGLVWWLNPNQFFSFPVNRPWLWLLVMLLYPLLSVLPQEVIYRVFFFHRYRVLLGDGMAMMAASAVSFGFLHIVYDNIWAPLLAVIGGLMFARSYRRTQSLYWVCLEHAIYGGIIFTVGMGHFFYEGF